MNLKILDFDKLSSLPYHLAIKSRLNNKLNSVSICGWDYYNSIWNTELFKKIQHILENSEGKHIDDVFSKISKMIPNNFPYNNHYILERTIKYDEKRTYRWWSAERDNFGTLYINLEGIICRTLRQPYKSYQTDYYRKQQQEKIKQQKFRDVVVHKTLLKLINNKLFYTFYINLIKKEKDILSLISDYRKLTPSTSHKKDYWTRYNNQRYVNKHKLIAEQEIELQKVRGDMNKIENDEYNIFYESNVYLYSLQKECPHFEQVIKIENK